MNRTNDSDLRRLFAAARQAGARQAPAFDRLWEAARGHRRRRLTATRPSRKYSRDRKGLTPLRLAAAAVLLAAAALGLARWTWDGAPPSPGRAAARTVLIDWQGPTDFLLEMNGELFSTLPAIGIAPYLPGVTPEEELASAR